MRKRVRAVATLGASATAFALLATTSPVIVSRAAWQDSEWTTAPIGVVDCGTTPYETRAEGALLSGGLLGIDLDDVADVHGMVVTSDGQQAIPQPTSAQPSGEYAWRNPLKVEALFDAISLELPTVRDLLQLPLDTDTGVLTQYGQAEPHGRSVGASGLVTNGGIIDLDPDHPPEPPADLATVNLMGLTSALGLGSLLEDVADLRLETGAVAARASLDACADDFGATTLSREYAVNDLDLVVESDVLASLVTAIEGVISDLETSINGLLNDEGVISGLISGVGGLLGGIPLINPSATLGINLDLPDDLLTASFSDPAGILHINPERSEIAVDIESLLAEAFSENDPTFQLNALTPNTSLLSEPAILETLTSALTSALNDWVSGIREILYDAVTIQLTLGIQVILLVLPIGVDASIDASLRSILEDTATVSVSASVPIVGDLLNLIVTPLVNGLTGVVASVVGEPLNAIISDLVSSVGSLVGAIIATVSTLYTNLFLDGIVDITLNAQNAPTSGNPGPTSWDSLPPGQFDVAAIRIGILDALGELGVELFLGRASVGPGSATTIP